MNVTISFFLIILASFLSFFVFNVKSVVQKASIPCAFLRGYKGHHLLSSFPSSAFKIGVSSLTSTYRICSIKSGNKAVTPTHTVRLSLSAVSPSAASSGSSGSRPYCSRRSPPPSPTENVGIFDRWRGRPACRSASREFSASHPIGPF